MTPAAAPDRSEPPARFPDVTGRTLLDAELQLPADLPGVRTLAVIAFRRNHQSTVDRWIERAVAAGIPPTSRGAAGPLPVAVVEIPVLGAQWRVARRVIDGGMSSAIRDPDVLARTITVYTDATRFRRSLGIRGGDEVQALVVDRAGSVLARASGEPDEAAWARLAAVLDAPGGA